MKWTLTIPRWHPHRLNQLVGCHFGSRSRRKRQDRELVGGHFLAAGLPRAAGKRRVSLALTLRPRQRAGDPDAYWKSLLDALAACGAIAGDNRQAIELGAVTFERGDAQTWGTRIVLEDNP